MADERVKEEALQILGLFQALPRLVVFDLDYTLWPFYCECLPRREMPYLYPQARGILLALQDRGIDMAIASRSPAPAIAKAHLEKLQLQSSFVARVIFSSRTHKTEHFQKIRGSTEVPFQSMLFFDDEYRNIEAVSAMGVTSIFVGDGVNLAAFKLGLETFAKNSINPGSSSKK